MTQQHRHHPWDYDSQPYGDPPRCAACGAQAQTNGVDVPANAVCDCPDIATDFDGSDHLPGCEYFSGQSCPAAPAPAPA